MENFDQRESKEVKSNVLTAGKRTYFIDLKETGNAEHYLVIAESKKKFDEIKGHFFYEKHKIFLSARDLERFAAQLDEVVQYAKEHFPEEELNPRLMEEENDRSFSDDSGFDDTI